MDRWATRMEKRLAENEIKVFLLIKYVDDINFILGTMCIGLRWTGARISYEQEEVKTSIEEGKNERQVTMEVIKAMSKFKESQWM